MGESTGPVRGGARPAAAAAGFRLPMAGAVLGLLVAGVLATLSAIAMATPAAATASLEGIHKIQHVVVIMQENRSFDSYFGTYPGANGIPAGVCVPDPR